LDTALFDQAAFQSRISVAPATRELIWSVICQKTLPKGNKPIQGAEFRAGVNSLVQLRALDQRKSEFASRQVLLRLERIRIELVLGTAVNVDGHLKTGGPSNQLQTKASVHPRLFVEVRQCRIISAGGLLFENLFREEANLTGFIPLVHQITLARLSEVMKEKVPLLYSFQMICPVFVAELGPVISNRLFSPH
jgi:hypothetical protein